MYGNPAGIQGGDSGGRYDDEPFVGAVSQVTQERGLAGSRLSRKENMAAGAVDESNSHFRNAFLEYFCRHWVHVFLSLCTRITGGAAIRVAS